MSHLFGAMYDLVNHVVIGQYFSEKGRETPKQNSKLSPLYRKRTASCDSVGLFQEFKVNMWKLCSNLLHPYWHFVCWSINYWGNLLKILNSNCGLVSFSFECCQLSLHIFKKQAYAFQDLRFPLNWLSCHCVVALEQHPSQFTLLLTSISLFRLVFPWFLFFIFLPETFLCSYLQSMLSTNNKFPLKSKLIIFSFSCSVQSIGNNGLISRVGWCLPSPYVCSILSFYGFVPLNFLACFHINQVLSQFSLHKPLSCTWWFSPLFIATL